MDGSFLQCGWWVSSIHRNVAELRSVAVPCGEEHATFVVARKAAARHPDTSSRNTGANTSAFSGELLNYLARNLIPSKDPACEIVLSTMTSKTCVDELPMLQQARSLMMYASSEDSVWIVAGSGAFKVDRKVHTLAEIGSTDSMDVVAAVGLTTWTICTLVQISFRSEIPRILRKSELFEKRAVVHTDAGSMTPVAVIPTVGLMSVQPSRSETRNGLCRLRDATITPVFAFIL